MVAGVGVVVAVVVAITVFAGTLGRAPGDNGSSAGLTTASPTRAPAAAAAPTATPSATPRATPSPTLAPTTVRIAISLPLTGSSEGAARAARDGALLAIRDAQPIPNVPIQVVVLDHAREGVADAAVATADVQRLVADPGVVAVVGPFTAAVAQTQVPVSSAAGLLQCSPAAVWPSSTDLAWWKSLTPSGSHGRSFIRVGAPLDAEGREVAQYASWQMGSVIVVDDGTPRGLGLVQGFEAQRDVWYVRVDDRLTLSADLESRLARDATDPQQLPGAVYFTGASAADAARVRSAMAGAGLGSVPLLVSGAVTGGTPSGRGSYIRLAGALAAHTYAFVGASHDMPGWDAFAARYRAAYGRAPDGDSANGYACAQLVVEAIRAAAARGSVTRDAVRAAGADRNVTIDTLLGGVRMDFAGFAEPAVVSIYVANPATGTWEFFEQAEIAVN